MWQPPPPGNSQQGQSDACHQPRLLPQLDLRNRILSVRLPSQFERRVQDSLGESRGGASSAVLLPETSLLTVLMYCVGALPVTLLHCSVGAFRVPYLSCFFSPRSPSSLSLLSAPAWMSKTISACPVCLLLVVSLALVRESPEQAATLDLTTVG